MKTALVVCLQVLLVAWSVAAMSPIDILRGNLRRKGGDIPISARDMDMTRILSHLIDSKANVLREMIRMTGDGDEHCSNGQCFARGVQERARSRDRCISAVTYYTDINLLQWSLSDFDVVDIRNFKIAESVQFPNETIHFFGRLDVLKEINADTNIIHMEKQLFSRGVKECFGFDKCGAFKACEIVERSKCLRENSTWKNCECPVAKGSYYSSTFFTEVQKDYLQSLNDGIIIGGLLVINNDGFTGVLFILKKTTFCFE